MTDLRVSMMLVALTAIAGCGDALQFDLTAKVTEFTVAGEPHLHHGNTPLELADVPPIELHFGALRTGSIHIKSLRFFVTDTSREDLDDADTFDFLTGMTVKNQNLKNFHIEKILKIFHNISL